MSSDLSIRARAVSKRYQIRTDGVPASWRKRVKREWFAALDSIDLDVERGEVVGLVGRNGSGKSTLLKVLCRVTAPTSGYVDVWGRMGTLLEVGTGFHNELTGRENVYLNGAILGMKKSEIDRQFDNIVEFANVGPFLDTPAKRYSSGMRVRLAFAVAAHLNPEILLIDEVLAVGDADFQRRCLDKMHSVATEEGRTVLFVSHNMASIEQLCDRVIVLEDGNVAYDGATGDAVAHYLATSVAGSVHDAVGVFRATGNHVKRVVTTDGHHRADRFLTGQPLHILVDVENFANVKLPVVTVIVSSASDQVIFVADTRSKPPSWEQRDAHGAATIELIIPELPLVPGHFWVKVAISDLADNTQRDVLSRVAQLDVVGGNDLFGGAYQAGSAGGVVFVQHDWTIRTSVGNHDGR